MSRGNAFIDRITHHLYEPEYRPGIQGILESHPRALVWAVPVTINVLVIVLILWLAFSHIDVISPAQGRIIPNSRMQLIQSKEIGVVEAILVKDGDHVQQGQLLLQLRGTDAQADVGRLQNAVYTLRAKRMRLSALENYLTSGKASLGGAEDIPDEYLQQERSLLERERASYDGQYRGLKSKLESAQAERNGLKAEITRLEKLIPYAETRRDRNKSLAEQGLLSRNEYDVAMEDLISKEEDLRIKRHAFDKTESEIRMVRAELSGLSDNFRRDIADQRIRTEQELTAGEAELSKALSELSARYLVAPLGGIVHNMAVHTPGGVVQSGQVLMQIVPENSPLEVEAKVLNRDVGFVTPGQKVKVKLDAFPFTRYGYVEGVIKRVEQASVLDEKLGDVYPAVIELADNQIKADGRWIGLRAGMTCVVDVRVGERRVIEYLLSPFFRYKDEALRER
ncbi:MAG: HlyD family type I secretion periplasmic adaptor subunit [Pseudomonadota bacterium]